MTAFRSLRDEEIAARQDLMERLSREQFLQLRADLIEIEELLELMPVESIADQLIELALLRGVALTLFDEKPELMEPYGGVAALSYVRLTAPGGVGCP